MKKRLWALTLALVMVLTTIVASTRIATAAANDSMDAYAAEVVGSYLHANGIWDNESFLSQAYPIYHVSEECISHYMYFVLKEDGVVGRLAVYSNAGEYVSSYIHGSIEGLDTDSPFQLFLAEESLFLRQNQIDIFVSGEEQNVTVENEIPFSSQALQENVRIISSQVSGRMTNYYLSVPFVANDSANGVGICWAACIASRVNYHQGTTLSARNVYDKCSAYLTGRPSGTPEGYPVWVQYGYNLYGISTDYVASGKNFAQICDLLNNDKPIYCWFDRGVASHAVLLIGVYQEGTTNIYMFRDSNESDGVVSINVSADALNDSSLVTYTNSSYSYSQWIGSIY